MSFLEAQGIHFAYRIGGLKKVPILRGLDLKIEEGELVAIQGSSGSGKSTLLYVLGAMLHPDAGRVMLDGVDLSTLGDLELAQVRNRTIGFVFQQFHLLARATVLENILLPALYPCETSSVKAADRERAVQLAQQLGIGEHLHHLPNQLSGGQQQRVAIARALLSNARLILADEPTGNLDSENARQTIELLKDLNRQGRTVVIITHDPEVARQCPRVIHIRDGKFEGEVSAREAATVVPPPAEVTPRSGSFHTLRLIRTLLPMAWDNLRRNKARSILTMLGITIGIASVLAMTTLGKFAQERILETYEAMGVNKLGIDGWPNWELKATDKVSVSFRSFSMEKDLLALKHLFPEVVYMSPVLRTWATAVNFGGKSVTNNVRILGVGADYAEITRRKILVGRTFTPYHIESRSSVCLIGYEIAQRLFSGISPEGQIIYATSSNPRPFACKVIGVLKPQTSNQEWSQPNLQILTPYTAYANVAENEWDTLIRQAVLQITSGADVEKTGKKIKAYFETKYGKSGKFYVDSDAVLISQMKRFLSIFSLLLAGISLISLLVGGIGIMNMMLVSVAERLKEIGLRKALGATGRSVRVQFLLESVVLCAMAGIVGLIGGFVTYEGAIYGATRLVPKLKFEWIVDPWAAVISVSAILIVGVASGLVPALRAEKLQVIEALRSE